MTPAARIQSAITLLDNIWHDSKPADGVVAAYFRANRYAGAKDRAEITRRVYRVLRSHARLNWWLEHQGVESNARSQVLADLALNEGKDQGEVFSLFNGEKFAPAPLKPQEKEMASKICGHALEIKAMPVDIRLETPPLYAQELHEAFGDAFEKEMVALLDMPRVDIRVNPLSATRQEVLDTFKKEEVDAKPTPYSPWGVRLAGRFSLQTHPLYLSGKIEIQDEGSQLIALLTGVKPGQQACDFCAGAGGKTLAMGAMMNNKGRITATDVLPKRLTQAAKRFRRAGLHNIETKVLEGENDKWVKRHRNHFDAVLVDAPCTGSGTWRRHPDMRWRQLGPPLEILLPMQQNILGSAARLVKTGGRLVYATCSLLPSENERQVEAFLKNNEGFEIVPLSTVWQEAGLDGAVPCADPFMRLTPGRHGTDGFFAAVLRRVG